MATININKATKEQLMTIRDIGATRATAIINERQNQFPLTLKKFKQIPGISAHIRDHWYHREELHLKYLRKKKKGKNV
jgi:DNA uptake protein ComE-like DNA-binding protein